MTNTATGPEDQRGYQSLLINDFSPGIFSSSWTVGLEGAAESPGPFPAPLGAADGNHTVGCMNLLTGGLGPLPAMTQSHTPADFGMGTPVGSTQSQYLCLFNTAQNGDFTGGNELLTVQSWTDSGGTNHAYLQSLLWSPPSAHTVYTGSGGAFPVGVDWPDFCCYPFATRVVPSGPATVPGTPVIALAIGNQLGSIGYALLLYPDPANPTVYGTKTIPTGADAMGFTFGHQGRICMLPFDTTSWPTGADVPTFDLLSYTDPSNTETWPVQDEVFGPENPYGYGGITSVSAGELFMIKCRGGAVIVQGDLNNPTVTALPAVKSTGPMYGQVASDPSGSFYCAQDEGAWVWNGGNASTKISVQIDDDFYVISRPLPQLRLAGPGIPSGFSTYGYFVQRWGSWMLFSNNWLYNNQSGSWWRLYDPSVASFFYYTIGYHPQIMYAGVPWPLTDATPLVYQFDRTKPANSYTWQSLAIRPSAKDRLIDAREVTVRAANVTLDANATIAVYLVDGNANAHQCGQTWTLSATTREVQSQSFNTGRNTTGSLEALRLRLVASATSAGAPVVYDLVVGYRTRERIVTT